MCGNNYESNVFEPYKEREITSVHDGESGGSFHAGLSYIH